MSRYSFLWRILGAALLMGLFFFPRAAEAQNPKMYIAKITVQSLSGTEIDSVVTTCNGFSNVSGGFGPQIEYENKVVDSDKCTAPTNGNAKGSVKLCVNIAHSSDVTSVDYVQFQVFKFKTNSNPLDEASSPPIRTFYIFNVTIGNDIPGSALVHGADGTQHENCTEWNGFYNIDGIFGKTNGQFGFRATAHTKQTSAASGSVDITNTVAYPAATTTGKNQFPINVDVVNIHSIVSSPTVVGRFMPIAAQPYNLSYRLSKDADVIIEIINPADGSTLRTLVNWVPKVGEGIPSGGLSNADSWDGRDRSGNIVPRGTYLARFQAWAADAWCEDFSYPVDREVAMDPLQLTDVIVQPLMGANTSLAVLNYTLTEPAVAYVDIWSPDTRFRNTIFTLDPGYDIDSPTNNVYEGTLLRRFVEHKTSRVSVLTFWDGRDEANVPKPDDNYIYAINAQLPSYVDGAPALIQNSKPQIGYIPVSRGMVGLTQISPNSSVFGSTPAISGLPPYNFGYSLSRDAHVTMTVLDPGGAVVKTLANREIRPGGQLLVEKWMDGIKDDGTFPSSGSYTVQLFAEDTLFSDKVTTTTASFMVNMFRITDVKSTPLLSGASDYVNLSFVLSQPMFTTWNIYPPGTLIPSSGPWPPPATSITLAGGGQAKPVSMGGMRPGRSLITEFWDGRRTDGLYVSDGHYLYTLVAQSTTTPVMTATDRIVGGVTVARGQIVIPSFNTTPTIPKVEMGQTLPLPPFKFEYSITRQSSVTLHILTDDAIPQPVFALLTGDVRDANIINTEYWDGRDESGKFVPEGGYVVRLVARDYLAEFANPATAQLTLSVNPLRIYDVAVSPLQGDSPLAQISYQLSEPMKIVLWIYKPETSFDDGGNAHPANTLVKRIIGIRPARETITEYWDGRDMQLVEVPDGNYLFKLKATPDISKVDSINGKDLGATWAFDEIISEIPVSRASSGNPKGDFEKNTIIYPNPARTPAVKFRVRVPIQGNVAMRFYTLNGDLVKHVSHSQFTSEPSYPVCGASDSYCNYTWARDNDAGRKLAPGVYFVVIREEATLGQGQAFQIVKKILLQ